MRPQLSFRSSRMRYMASCRAAAIGRARMSLRRSATVILCFSATCLMIAALSERGGGASPGRYGEPSSFSPS